MTNRGRWSRRELLRVAAATSLGAAVPWSAAVPRARAESGGRTKRKPRYFVTLFLRGGMDAVYTTDPKEKRAVDPDVDVPYGPDAIVDAGAVQLGPHWQPLQKWASRMAIVRGVHVHTANHESGAFQMLRMKSSVTPNMPGLYDIIGQHRDTQPLGSVTLGKISAFEHTPGALATPTGDPEGVASLEALERLDDEDMAMLAAAYRKHASTFPSGQLSGRGARTRDYVTQVAGFLDKAKSIPRFQAKDWKSNKDTSADLQRTLWFLENDLACGITQKIFFDWDSHYRNADKQTKANGDFARLFDRFLTELHERRNEHGTLAEQTLLIVGSELGRFPVINGNLGKDHFPETQLVVMGPGIRGGAVFGRTGRRMQGGKVDVKSGAVDDTKGVHLTLDDIGATVMHHAGLNPRLYGYDGRPLEFLEGA